MHNRVRSASPSRRHRRSVTALVVAVAAVASLPAAASASTLTTNGFQLNYDAAPGEVNSLTISFDGTNYKFQDAPGVTITPTAPCSAVGNVGTCPAVDAPGDRINDIRALLDDQNDSAAFAASVGPPVGFVLLDGQDGNDTLTAAPNVQSQLNGDDPGGTGNDVLIGQGNDDNLIGEGGNDTLTGAAGDDGFFGGDGNDAEDGGVGDDRFSQFEADGADVMVGGAGQDFFDADNAQVGLAISLNDVADDGTNCPGPGCEKDNLHSDIESIRAGDGNDVIVGSADRNRLDAGPGNDSVNGGDGGDSVSGDEGDDGLNGGPGADTLSDFGGADSLNGGPGDDLLFPAFSDDGVDTMSGGGGFDVLDSTSECCTNIGVRIDLDGQADDGTRDANSTAPKDNVMPDVEDLLGTQGSDILIGSKRPNELDGNAGADRLIGGLGADGLIGDRGRDALTGGKGADEMDGGGGGDLLRSRDGRADDLRCGSAVDRVKADRADRVAPDCDKVAVPHGRARR